MINKLKFAFLLAVAPLAACSTVGGEGLGTGDYAFVPVKRVSVGNGSLIVTAPRPYNKMRSQMWYDVREVEDWTLNGPLLDGISFVTGIKNNKNLVYQRSTDAQQVPKFLSNMTAPEITAMLESLFRVRGGAVEFRTLSLKPRPFLGSPLGFEWDFEHLDGDELWRKGRAVGAVVNGRLYLILVDAARAHYYPEVLPDFEALVASAQLRR